MSPDGSLGFPRNSCHLGELHFRIALFASYGLPQKLLVYDISRTRPVGCEWKDAADVGFPIGSARRHVQLPVLEHALRQVNPRAALRTRLTFVHRNGKSGPHGGTGGVSTGKSAPDGRSGRRGINPREPDKSHV